jgi:hypothetical protein
MSASHRDAFPGLAKTHFDQLPWSQIIAASPRKECQAYQDAFRDMARELAEAGNTEATSAARAMQAVALLRLNLDKPRQPFSGLSPIPGTKFPGPEDFGEPLLAAFADLANEAADPEFKARLADLCWSTQQKRNFALVAPAIEAYLASAASLCQAIPGETEMQLCQRWDATALRLRRALQLAKMTRHKLLDTVKAAFDQVFAVHSATAPLLELGSLLASYQNEIEGDTAALIQIAAKCANRAETEQQWGHLRHFLRLKANWEKKAGQPDQAVKSEEARAETYLRDATANPTFMGKAHWVAKAITAYRDVSPKSPRIEALKRLMAEYQRLGMAEMQTITYPVGNGTDPAQAAKHVAGKAFAEAIWRLAGLLPPMEEKRFHEAALMRCKDPFFALVSQNLIDWDGRLIAKRGSPIDDDPKVREHAIRAEMFRMGVEAEKVVVSGYVEPARLQLLSDHNPTLQDFYRVLVDSPFIPPGREYFFARGLYEGLNGDFLVAAHLLIPQFEHALRFHLEERGVDVTTFDQGVQELMDINKLFGIRREDLLILFGHDQVFELEGLLIRRYGSNLRNSLAHGLFWPPQFFDTSVIYFWWVTLRLCVFHLFPHPSDSPSPPASATTKPVPLEPK